ncbi:MAG: galactose-1-phosphate uridylyltransferase [Chitinophaga sp.]|jgi:UDPglucose--hexose-1-phosphate uridylyltransferase|nr:galactose-1-phosphate uridylyltransferase [Chitinophaga sp.]
MESTFNIKEHPHRRLNILTGEWVLVSPHRNKRPWQGKVEILPVNNRPAYDANCYLCPGNTRADGSVNPQYEKPFAFTNDFSALLPDVPEGNTNENNLLCAESEKGICRVICFSPRHDLTLPDLSVNEIVEVINLWQDEFELLKKHKWIKYIQIFENKGEIMGCSNPHPHGQIWSSSHIPVEIEKETKQQQLYFEQYHKSLLQDYLELELQLNERVVVNEKHFAALVPYWAVWPYETIVISKRQIKDISLFTEEDKQSLAATLKQLTQAYDKLFNTSFPYSAGIHQQPVNNGEHIEWHWHMHFYPPLLRSATVKKFMVGYEMLANAQRDITPEFAAERLRELV